MRHDHKSGPLPLPRVARATEHRQSTRLNVFLNNVYDTYEVPHATFSTIFYGRISTAESVDAVLSGLYTECSTAFSQRNSTAESMDVIKMADGSGEATGSDPTPRILIIGAGSRGNAYARAICQNPSLGRVVAVAEPVQTRRARFGRRYIWGDDVPSDGDAFAGWREYLSWERARREKAAKGGEGVPDGVDGVFVCTLDETHREVVTALAPLCLHVMCEKPLATSLADCLTIYRSFVPQRAEAGRPAVVFGVGHVLRYSPHNKLLRKILLEERAIGEIVSVEHTEPVGWWHFAHSYVR